MEQPLASGKLMSFALNVDVKERIFTNQDGASLHAIGELNFSLQASSFTVVVGPSGCGKTTTLRMILGLDQGYIGSITSGLDTSASNGAEGTQNPEKIAAVFQEPRLLPWRTVEQNVRLALPDALKKSLLEELFDTLGLQEVRHFFPSQLSLGLARRAAIARAFAIEPSLLILDEPFVSLDEPTAERLRALLLRVWQARPTTVLMVTHNVREAAELADTILVFSQRPTRVVRSIAVEKSRDQRDPAYIQSIVDELKKSVASTDAMT